MIRIPEDKAVDVVLEYQMFNDNGVLVTEDEIWVRLVEEQYNRIKTSYDSGGFKKMNEDDSLKDLCDLFSGLAQKAKWQRFVFDYPTDIIEGITFEDQTKAQWDEEALNEMLDAIFTGFTPEEEAAIQNDADQAYNEAVRDFEIDGVIVNLIKWMRNKGFDVGERRFELNDGDGYYIGSLDIAWPSGVYGPKGSSTKPLALRIDADDELVNAAKEHGFTCFTSIDDFKAFIEENY